MNIIEHSPAFKSGTRVLLLRGRNKDRVVRQRAIARVSHSEEMFDRTIEDFVRIAKAGERIYASAGRRSMPAAIREFKRRQLDADYDNDPEKFYRSINDRWVASLMQPSSQSEKLWLFDCDDADTYADLARELDAHYSKDLVRYDYKTKSGRHVITKPFNRTLLSDKVRATLHENPIMLWAF